MRRDSFVFQGARVAYWKSAERHRDVVMVLHGLGADHLGLLDMAARLPGTTVVAPDLPGFGRSDPLTGPHTLDNYAAMIEELRRHLGLARFTLLGHSLGGSIAFAYAGRYGPALDALCLLNPMFAVDGPTARLAKVYYDLSTWLPGPLGRLLLTSRPMIYMSDRAVFTTADTAVRRRILRMDYATAKAATPRAIRESYLSLRDTALDRVAGSVAVPTLLLTGALDRLSTPRALTRLHRLIPGSHLEIVANGGHLLPVERPALIAEMVDTFLAGARRATHGRQRTDSQRTVNGHQAINGERAALDDLGQDGGASRMAPQPGRVPGT